MARLPLDSDKLVDILCETEPRAANNSDDEAHTSFWLIVADQFAKRGIVCDRARDKALTIIDAGSDIAMHDKLGMSPSDLRKRRKMLEAVRVRLTASKVSSKPRLILKRPQVLLMAVGDVFVYPTFDGECINPILRLEGAGQVRPKGCHDSLETKWLVGLGHRRLRAGQQLDPFSLNIIADSSFYAYMGRQYDRAIAEAKRGIQLDPNCYTCRTYVGLSDLRTGQFKDALAEIVTVKFPAAAPIDVATTVSILALSGERQQALDLEKDLLAKRKQRYVCPYEVATGFTALGDTEQALHWLQVAYQEHSICVIWLMDEPRFDPLRSDPRFAAVLQDVGLPH